MVLRLSLCLHALIFAACAVDAGRCEDLRVETAGAANQLSRGCLSHDECRPILLACGALGAVRNDLDVRALSSALVRYESMCGCASTEDGGLADGGASDGGLPSNARALCLSGVCRIANGDVPAECAPARAAIVDAIAAQNRCAADTDCTALNVSTCPAICGAPIALRADHSAIDSAIAGLDAIAGCRDCDDGCPSARPVRCVNGACALEDSDGGVCGGLSASIDRILSTPGTCRGLADCRYVSFVRKRAGECGAAATLGDAARLGDAVSAWSPSCCAGCDACPPPPELFSRCTAGHCIGADKCPQHLTPASLRLDFTEPGPNGAMRTLHVEGSGAASVTPPGITGTATPDELASLIAATDSAALLCLDASFHPPGPTTLRIFAANAAAQVDVSYASGDPRPSGLALVERSLRGLANRLVGAP